MSDLPPEDEQQQRPKNTTRKRARQLAASINGQGNEVSASAPETALTPPAIGHNRGPPLTVEVLVISVPEAGAMAGLNRVRSYIAAKRGDIPTITIGGRLKVPVRKWTAILNGEPA